MAAFGFAYVHFVAGFAGVEGDFAGHAGGLLAGGVHLDFDVSGEGGVVAKEFGDDAVEAGTDGGTAGLRLCDATGERERGNEKEQCLFFHRMFLRDNMWGEKFQFKSGGGGGMGDSDLVILERSDRSRGGSRCECYSWILECTVRLRHNAGLGGRFKKMETRITRPTSVWGCKNLQIDRGRVRC